MHDLDGDLLLELSISPLGQVNLAHPTGAQGTQHPIGPYSISHHFWSMHPNEAGLQTAAGLRPGRACVYESGAPTPILGAGSMSNGNEHKTPPPPPPPPPPPGGTQPGGGANTDGGSDQPPQIQLRRAAGIGGAVGGAIGGVIGALIGCCLQHLR